MLQKVGMSVGGDRILRSREVCERLSISRSTLYLMMKRGRFPRPLHISTRAVGWLESAVQQYMTSLTSKTSHSST